MTEQEMRNALRDRNLKAVARETKLGHNTLVRFRKGHQVPRVGTLAVLREYLSR